MKFALSILVLLLSLNGHAAELRGDWESAGDMPMPYEPKYDFEYDCQLELKGKGPYIALTRFSLRNEEKFVETNKNTRWQWVKLGDRVELSRAPKKHGIQLEGYYASLTLWPAEEKAKDSVKLNLGWKLNWQEVEFSGKTYEFHFTRSDARLSGDFYLSVRGKKSETRKEIHGQLNCEKVK